MARRPDVQYVRYYTDGSAARQPEPKAPRKRQQLPKVKQQPKQTLYIQPMAIAGVLLSVVMLVMMIAGSVELYHAQQEKKAMQGYVLYLSKENMIDRAEYEEDLDLETIEKSALALGMIPVAEAKQIKISVPVTEVVEEPGFWEKTILFLEGLFA